MGKMQNKIQYYYTYDYAMQEALRKNPDVDPMEIEIVHGAKGYAAKKGDEYLRHDGSFGPVIQILKRQRQECRVDQNQG